MCCCCGGQRSLQVCRCKALVGLTKGCAERSMVAARFAACASKKPATFRGEGGKGGLRVGARRGQGRQALCGCTSHIIPAFLYCSTPAVSFPQLPHLPRSPMAAHSEPGASLCRCRTHKRSRPPAHTHTLQSHTLSLSHTHTHTHLP